MILDDNHPDYYLGDSPKEQVAAEPHDESGRVIDFAPTETTAVTDGEPVNATTEPKKPRKHGKFRKAMIWLITVGVIAICAAFYLRYCSPYAVDATVTAYVVNVEKRGLLIKTWEAQVVDDVAVSDSSALYSHPQQFSVTSDKMARLLQLYQEQHRVVKITFEKYYATLPWRGASKYVVTAVEPAITQ